MAEKKGNGVTIQLICVRASFPQVFERDKYKRYSSNFLIVPGSDADKQIRAAIQQAAKNAWGEEPVDSTDAEGNKIQIPSYVAKLKQLKAKDEVCYRDGANKTDKDGNPTPGYEGMWYLTGTSQVQPTLLNEVGDEITKESGKLYSGSYVIAIVEIWPQNGPEYYGMRCQLQGLKHYKDGESFGSGRRARADEFAEVPGNVDDDNSDLVGAGNPDDDIPF